VLYPLSYEGVSIAWLQGFLAIAVGGPFPWVVSQRRLRTEPALAAWRYAFHLAGLGIESVADGIESGIATAAWIESADGWQTRFSTDGVSTPLSCGFGATAAADLARAGGTNDPDLWRAAIEAWSEMPYLEAKATWRLAQALIERDPSDPEAPTLLDDAERTAVRLKAMPLLDAVGETRRAIAP